MEKDFSSIYTENKVVLIDGVIKKKFKSSKKMSNELKFYDALRVMNAEDIAPRLLNVDAEENSITIDYCPKYKELTTEEILRFAKKFHTKTIGSKHEALKSDASKEKWESFLKTKFLEWKEKLDSFQVEITFMTNELFQRVMNRDYDICIIHRDFRNANIGEFHGETVIFDFEIAMWGDPLFDVGRILVENKEENLVDFVADLYNEKTENIEIYCYLYAMSFLF